MGDRKRNIELGASKSVGKRMAMSKLPVKRRFQVSLRMSASLPRRLRMAVNGVPALEEDGDSSDDKEILPPHRVLTELFSGSDTEASDRDEENVASGYVADSEMEPRRQRVTRIQPPRKLKAGIVYC